MRKGVTYKKEISKRNRISVKKMKQPYSCGVCKAAFSVLDLLVEHVAICKESLVVKPTKTLVKPTKSPVFKKSSVMKTSKTLMKPSESPIFKENLVVKPNETLVNPTKSLVKPMKTVVKPTECKPTKTLVKPTTKGPQDTPIKIESDNFFKNAKKNKKLKILNESLVIKPTKNPGNPMKNECDKFFKNALKNKKSLNFEDIILRSVISAEISERISNESSTPSVKVIKSEMVFSLISSKKKEKKCTKSLFNMAWTNYPMQFHLKC